MQRDLGYKSLFSCYWEGYKSKALWDEGRSGEREAGTEKKRKKRRQGEVGTVSLAEGERDKEEEQMGDPLASDAGKKRLGVGRDHLLKGQGRPADYKIGLLFL